MLNLHAGLPVALVMLLVVGWLTTSKVNDYVEARDQVQRQMDSLMASGDYSYMAEIDLIRSERVQGINRQLVQDLTLAFVICVIGISVPILVSRHVSAIVQKNLDLLDERLASSGREGSALMPQTFDLIEFDDIVETMRHTVRIRNETEQRWRRAEVELVSANEHLMRRANELKQGRKLALSMMEDAEIARNQLELVNTRLNEVIQQAEQSARSADFANKAKSDFLATMSHEIRTPLNGVIGFMEMLLGTELNEEQREYAETVRSSGEALMALINDVLDFSKIESGHLNLEVRDFHLTRMLRDTTSVFFSDAAKKGINLQVDIDERIPRQVLGDENRMRQIITNLLANAVKFTQEGTVLLNVDCYSISEEEGVCEIEFEVRDTGIGMNKQQLQRLFRPFSQGDTSTTRKYGGTGLGLAICKRLAEAMGGRIWATSKEGEGASFFTRLPLEISTQVEPEMSAKEVKVVKVLDAGDSDAKPGEHYPLNIAVAEDNAANQRVLMIMLKRLGWQAAFSENGAQLIDHLKGNPVDLVFMDLQMPVMDGIEATARIREGEAGEALKDVKIIALTANALQGDEERCLEAGMNAYMSKPIKLEVLRKTILSLAAEMDISPAEESV
ncbi:MAG: ATP-binding protein [Opitutales bacterium]|jgi:signal transduction histidine kinase/ActR/RegA family two-component response regulator|nr:ATP-binding protein [Opitutales bacterium]MDP4776522.1 ATP-binding protein [Opitutales bacterium]MDP4884430.1 ATP-binding protein [Opitutales bacterium]MDP5079318.1 ATP-binding protein [Opitutales bacterium]